MSTNMTNEEISDVEQPDEWPEKRLRDLFQYHYGLTLHTVTPASRGWQCNTDSGRFTLVRLKMMDEAYWGMVERLLTHLQMNGGLLHLPNLVRTKQHKLSFNGFHARYLLWRKLQAGRCQWRNLGTWEAIGASLATMHRASRDFPQLKTDRRFQAAGQWHALWEHNLRRLETIRAACAMSANKRPIDRLWMGVATYTATLIETALYYLEKAGGDEAVLAHMDAGKLGQHHLDRDSWGSDPSGLPRLLDWDQTVLDIRVRDLAQMIHLAYGRKRLFSERVRLLLAAYEAEASYPLRQAEWALLYARLLFPDPLVKAVRDIYEKREIDEKKAEPLLQQLIEKQRKREYHLRLMPRLFQSSFSITIPGVDWLN